jgi:UDP:flavonoid glycosyltransferase YjiC (YdhE family)
LIAFVTWDGGGNVAVALGIAAALGGRGHAVTVIGPGSLRERIAALGLGFAELGVTPPRDPAERGAYLREVAGTRRLAELRELVAGARAVVVDCNLAWALDAPLGPPTAVLVHTALGLYLPVWQAVLDALGARPAAEAWASAELLLVASVPEFDRPHALDAVYVGPVAAPGQPTPVRVPDGRPLVLVSYSTESLQNSPERVQAALDALAGEPVSVLASTSGLFDPARLRAPANATVAGYLPHEQVMPHAAAVVCHAGHGTTMAALRHGVPLVCLPGLGRDQAPISARVQELGLGVAAGDDIAGAVRRVLGDPGYRDRARELMAAAACLDGPERAADAIEGLSRAGG